MKRFPFIFGAAGLAFFFAGVLGGGVDPVWAAEDSQSWRPTYDLVMRWVNFIILVAVIVKFARVPLKNFLQGQKEQLEKNIHKLEQEKEKAEADVAEIRETLSKDSRRIAALKDRIVAQGEKSKAQIIEDARREAGLMIESARRKADGRLRQAAIEFKQELFDGAIDTVLKKLPRELTPEDNQRIVDQYIDSLQ